MSAALGKQLLIEAYRCDREVLNDPERLTRYMLEAAHRMGATVVGHNFHRFSPHGVSGVVVIAESHLALHTWPEYDYAALDFFTCGTSIRTDPGLEYLKHVFGAHSMIVTEVPRGVMARIETIGLIAEDPPGP